MEQNTFYNVYVWLIVAAVAADLTLGVLVFLDSPRRTINRIFALLCLALALWSMTFFALTFVKTKSSAVVLTRLYYANMLFMTSLFYHLVLGSMCRGSMNGSYTGLLVWFERTKSGVYIVSTGMALLVISGMVTQNVQGVAGFWLPKANNVVLGTELIFVILITISILVLIRSFQKSRNPAQKERLCFIIFGIATAILGAVLSIMPLQTMRFNVLLLTTLGHLITSLSLLLLVYALISFHIFLFGELIRKAFTYFVMVGILVVIYNTGIGVGEILARHDFKETKFGALIITSLFVALVFHSLRYWVENGIEALFFKSLHVHWRHLKDLCSAMIRFSNRGSFLKEFVSGLKGLGFKSISLLMCDAGDQDLIDVLSPLDGHRETKEPMILSRDSLLVQYLGAEKKGELNKYHIGRRILSDWERQEIVTDMERLGADVCFPLYSSRKKLLFGILTIGDSSLGVMAYTGRNIFWLEQLADHVTIMLENFDQAEFEKIILPYIGQEQTEEIKKLKWDYSDYLENLNVNKCFAAIMMVDIRDFTKFTQSVTLEEVIFTLQLFRDKVTSIAHRYGGVVDKFIGDAVMMVFGSPLRKLEDPETNAVKCGLEIRDTFDQFNNKCKEEGRNPISIGIGIASGEVVAGTVVSSDRNEYTVIGDAVNLVARLEDVARDGQVLISDFMYENLRKKYMVKSWTTVMDGGAKGNLMFHEVLVLEPLETVQTLPIA